MPDFRSQSTLQRLAVIDILSMTAICSVNWEFCYSQFATLDEKVDLFYQFINDLIAKFVPIHELIDHRPKFSKFLSRFSRRSRRLNGEFKVQALLPILILSMCICYLKSSFKKEN